MASYLTNLLAEVRRLYQLRRHNLRFWLVLALLVWLLSALLHFPPLPSYAVVNAIGEHIWALWAVLSMALLLAPSPRVRLWGATCGGLLFLLASACFFVAVGYRISSGTLIYGLCTYLAFQVASGGAE